MLGIPHGALDGEIARTLWRARFGAAWFPVFAFPYLALSAVVVAGWHLAPRSSLALFLAASAWHFGSEDAPSTHPAEVLCRGGLPIAVPLLVHPSATLVVFATIAQAPLVAMAGWLWSASLCWLVLAASCAAITIAWGRWQKLMAPAALGCLFALLPPLTAFAIYFVCVHAPAHVSALISNEQRAIRVRSVGDAWRLALPITVLTVAIGGALWPLYNGAPASRLLCLTVQLLAALTVPHMLLDAWAGRVERSKPDRLPLQVSAKASMASSPSATNTDMRLAQHQ